MRSTAWRQQQLLQPTRLLYIVGAAVADRTDVGRCVVLKKEWLMTSRRCLPADRELESHAGTTLYTAALVGCDNISASQQPTQRFVLESAVRPRRSSRVWHNVQRRQVAVERIDSELWVTLTRRQPLLTARKKWTTASYLHREILRERESRAIWLKLIQFPMQQRDAAVSAGPLPNRLLLWKEIDVIFSARSPGQIRSDRRTCTLSRWRHSSCR